DEEHKEHRRELEVLLVVGVICCIVLSKFKFPRYDTIKVPSCEEYDGADNPEWEVQVSRLALDQFISCANRLVHPDKKVIYMESGKKQQDEEDYRSRKQVCRNTVHHAEKYRRPSCLCHLLDSVEHKCPE